MGAGIMVCLVGRQVIDSHHTVSVRVVGPSTYGRLRGINNQRVNHRTVDSVQFHTPITREVQYTTPSICTAKMVGTTPGMNGYLGSRACKYLRQRLGIYVSAVGHLSAVHSAASAVHICRSCCAILDFAFCRCDFLKRSAPWQDLERVTSMFRHHNHICI